jgi:hypothetical protein
MQTPTHGREQHKRASRCHFASFRGVTASPLYVGPRAGPNTERSVVVDDGRPLTRIRKVHPFGARGERDVH